MRARTARAGSADYRSMGEGRGSTGGPTVDPIPIPLPPLKYSPWTGNQLKTPATPPPPSGFCVEGLYCKRPIQCLASSENIDPPPPSQPGECVPPRLLCGGRTHPLGGEGVGGQ
jgi:hypothetical protein